MERISRILFKGGVVIDPKTRSQALGDVYVEAGTIKEVGPGLEIPGVRVVEVKGSYIAPGFIDLHCHLREPGREDEETVASGGYAALKGGFTRICCMPNTDPPIDSEGMVRHIQELSSAAGYARVMVVGCATRGREGQELSEMGGLASAGVVGFSDDGDPIADSHLMRRALEYSKIFGLPIINHCEDRLLSSGGVMHEGWVSTRLGLPGIPRVAEEAMVFRDLLLAEYTGGRLHLSHLSTQGSVEWVRWAKGRGIRVTADTCPHYLTLTHEACQGFDPNSKVNPPLRTREDLEALIAGLVDGTIDCIATDHAPHLSVEKELGFKDAPFGILGLETAFALSWMALARFLSLPEVVARLSYNPARVLGMEPPLIEPGREAELVVIDPYREWVYEAEKVASKSRNSPFIGQLLRGKVLGVLIGDRWFMWD